MTLAQRVRDHRYAKGWGPDELASRASISRTALYQIESGKTEQPRAGTLRRIAQALDIPTEALLGPNLGMVGLGWSSTEPGLPTRHEGHASAISSPSFSRFRLDDVPAPLRLGELERKFQELLASPLGEGVARIVEESYRILPKPVSDSRW
jgi:transcriptional regulator with XRE-family HTH domain